MVRVAQWTIGRGSLRKAGRHCVVQEEERASILFAHALTCSKYGHPELGNEIGLQRPPVLHQ
jgi:hypothetical protein